MEDITAMRMNHTATILVSSALALSLLAGCGKKGGSSTDASSASGSSSSSSAQAAASSDPVISNINLGDPEQTELLLPLEAEEGEVLDNPYYRRTTDPDGRPAYAVLKSSDSQMAYLPLEETVIYPIQEGTSYYEKKTLSYEVDGEPVTVTRYELWVSAAGDAADSASQEDSSDTK